MSKVEEEQETETDKTEELDTAEKSEEVVQRTETTEEVEDQEDVEEVEQTERTDRSENSEIVTQSSSEEVVEIECKGPEECPARLGEKGARIVCRRRTETFYDWLTNCFTRNRYYWEILKSTIMFLIALKMARECMMLKIPMKEYKPFNRCVL